jgi:hypothetical protein
LVAIGAWLSANRLRHQRRVEIADADILHLAGRLDVVERADLLGQRHAAAGPMQKQEIDIIGAQLLQALIDRGQEIGMLVVIDPDLGGEEDIAAGNAGCLNRFADLSLVAIDLRGVDMAETELDRLRHDAQHVRAWHAKRAEAESGDMCAIGADCLHGNVLSGRKPGTRPGLE